MTIEIKPRKGVQLPGVPAKGGPVPDELAREWIANGLADRIKPEPPARRDN